MKLYATRSVLRLLKEMGIPISRITFLSLEKKGIIPFPKHTFVFAFRKGKEVLSRAYTEEDIGDVARAILAYRQRSTKRK